VQVSLQGWGDTVQAWLTSNDFRDMGDEASLHYCIGCSWTCLVRGMRQWWWTCPDCGRRCATLYLPPNESLFACRRCHHLAYHSQNPDSWRRWVKKNLHPLEVPDRIPPVLQALLARLAEEDQRDPHPDYLSAEELIERSGLSVENLQALNVARLLVPDTKDGRYRPKLAGWAKKLAYLIHQDWTVEEIKTWTTERWRQPNPRQWPPEES
jgi:hypothetical protein